MGKSGSLPRWQLCRGISGSFRVEWVAGFVWNQWQPWSGIRSNIGTNKGLNRFSLRGKKKVQGQWQLYCLVHNIEKLANYGQLAA